MPLTRLTLTGIDDPDHVAALNGLAAGNPEIELGILYSEGRAGTRAIPAPRPSATCSTG